MLLEEIPRNRIAGSKDQCIYNFDKYCQIVPLLATSSCAYFPQSLCKQRILSNFWNFPNLISKKLFLSAVLNFFYPLIREVYHLFLCLGPSAFPNNKCSFCWTWLQLGPVATYCCTVLNPFLLEARMFLHALILILVLEGPKWKSCILPRVSILLEMKKKESQGMVGDLCLHRWLQIPTLGPNNGFAGFCC